jgi:hypothetical protein
MFVKQTKKANVAVLPRWMQNKKRQAVIGYQLLQHLYRDVSWLALSLTSAFSDFSNGLGFYRIWKCAPLTVAAPLVNFTRFRFSTVLYSILLNLSGL